MKENTEDDFTILNKDFIELWEVKKKWQILHIKHFFTGTLIKSNSLLIDV